jgi:hypothetical protein
MASEYAIHRFVGHGKLRHPAKGWDRLTPSGLASAFNVEHVAHHTNTQYFAPTSHKLAAASAVIPALGLALTPFVGPRRALSYGVGFAATYGAYEFIHRRIHTHAPRNAFGRWARRHHLAHHYKSPRTNHGVTSPIFDRLFGTHVPADKVKVPWQSPPLWLVDPATGDVRGEYRSEYELSRKRGGAAADETASPPVVDPAAARDASTGAH